jgi:hypothetical protein
MSFLEASLRTLLVDIRPGTIVASMGTDVSFTKQGFSPSTKVEWFSTSRAFVLKCELETSPKKTRYWKLPANDGASLNKLEASMDDNNDGEMER